MSFDDIPIWLNNASRFCLLGQIYPEIRAIAHKCVNDELVLIRYYMDREPIEKDWESIAIVRDKFHDLVGSKAAKVKIECLYSTTPKGHLEPLDGWLYSRREWDD